MWTTWVRKEVLRDFVEFSLIGLLRGSERACAEIAGSWNYYGQSSGGLRAIRPSCAEDVLRFSCKSGAFGLATIAGGKACELAISIDGAPERRLNVDAIDAGSTANILFVRGLPAAQSEISIRFVSSEIGELFGLVSIFLDDDPTASRTTHHNAEDLNKLPTLENTVSIHRRWTDNVGDLVCAPYLYFPFLGHDAGDILDWNPLIQTKQWARIEFMKRLEGKNIIVGGGGLLQNDYFASSIEYLELAATRKLIVWGAGHNGAVETPWHPEFNQFDLSLTNYDLIGVRDFGSRFEWVPCASCMMPQLSEAYETKRAIGFYIHEYRDGYSHAIKHVSKEDICSNSADIDTAIRFIGESECVISDSFHGVYWATLLGRKVIAIPSGHKFFSLRHQPPVAGFSNWQTALPLVRAFPDALTECRAKTLDFAWRVYNLLSSPD